jgi:hypothetical protein
MGRAFADRRCRERGGVVRGGDPVLACGDRAGTCVRVRHAGCGRGPDRRGHQGLLVRRGRFGHEERLRGRGPDLDPDLRKGVHEGLRAGLLVGFVWAIEIGWTVVSFARRFAFRAGIVAIRWLRRTR